MAGYETPKITELGSLQELTQSGTIVKKGKLPDYITAVTGIEGENVTVHS